MDKINDRYPYKKILYLNWYEAAIGHLLLFKHYVQKYSQNIYFLISDQGIMLKAVTRDHLKKVEDQLNKFFTAKIQELELSGSTNFYNNILEDIKEQTEKLKDSRDCPYINLVYSEKIRNSCIAMKKLGYTKPYQNWEFHERERKGFCFLIVRPEHRWKEIANNVYTLAKKRQVSGQKGVPDKSWQIEISYEKFVWFYLKQSFKNFKKSLQIKENKQDKLLTIVVKKDIDELSDLEKEIQTLTFFYRPTKPIINHQQKNSNKIIVLSPLEIEKITELIYHEFGLTALAKELRKKMTGFLIIGTTDTIQFYESEPSSHTENPLEFKEDLIKIPKSKVNVLLKLGRRHHLVSYENTNYVQVKLEKLINQTQYENILKLRLPCLPRYYYWYEPSENNPLNTSYLLREYYTQKFFATFLTVDSFSQIFLLNSLLNIVYQLHQKSVYVGSGLNIIMNEGDYSSEDMGSGADLDIDFGQIYVENFCQTLEQKRVIIEPGATGSKQEDMDKISNIIDILLCHLKDEKLKQQLKMEWQQNEDPFGTFLQNLEEYIESKS